MRIDNSFELLYFDFQFLILLNPPLNRSLAINKVDHYFSVGQQWPSKQQVFLTSEIFNRINFFSKNPSSINSYEALKTAFPLRESELAWLMAREFRRIVLNNAYVGNLLERKKTKSADQAFAGTITEYLAANVYKNKTNFKI